MSKRTGPFPKEELSFLPIAIAGVGVIHEGEDPAARGLLLEILVPGGRLNLVLDVDEANDLIEGINKTRIQYPGVFQS